MKIFNSIRLAYFEELGQDPEMESHLQGAVYLKDWVKNPYKGNQWLPHLHDYANGFIEKTVFVDSSDSLIFRTSTTFNPEEILNGHHKMFDYYYNRKNDCMLSIKKDDRTASNKEVMDKILVFLSKIFEENKWDKVKFQKIAIRKIVENEGRLDEAI